MSQIEDKYKDITCFVYCGGKCGGCTLKKTLKQYYTVLGLHNNSDFCERMNFHQNYSIYDVIEYNRKTQEKIYIIDSYRTPIERKMSSFFQNILKYLPNYKNQTLKSIIKHFNINMIYNLEEYHPIDEIMNHYGLPTFETFDFEKGYNLLVHENIHFIKIKFNDINNWSTILSNIFNRPIKIQSDNVSELKEYNDLYNKFKEVYYLPNLYYKNYLPNDKNFKIYNTKEEQEAYYAKWAKRLLPNM